MSWKELSMPLEERRGSAVHTLAAGQSIMVQEQVLSGFPSQDFHGALQKTDTP
jgi:hypothetical protein